MEWIVEAESLSDFVDHGRYTIHTKPLVRCKDCKYRYIDEKFGPSCELDTGDPYATGRNADEDNWFCADAERRTDEQNS